MRCQIGASGSAGSSQKVIQVPHIRYCKAIQRNANIALPHHQSALLAILHEYFRA
jgi:hypothetical protein